MGMAFEAARAIGSNVGSFLKEKRETSTIDDILKQALDTKDPAILQQSIGKILSQVSPERQGTAIQLLTQKAQKLGEEKKKIETQRAYEQAGLPRGAELLHPSVQAQYLRNQQPTKPSGALTGQAVPKEISSTVSNILESSKEKTADELAVAFDRAGVPRIYSNSYVENRRRQDEERAANKRQQETSLFKSNLSRADKIKESSDQTAISLPQKQTALNLMTDAISSKNLGFFSGDNLAEITGIEGLRSKEGAVFKTAGKEYFLGNISRAGARPNQWIEQQIADMMTKIGRSTGANLSVSRALQNELDLDKKRVQLTEEISDQLRQEGDLSQSKLGPMLNKKMAEYAEQKQNELFNDLRAIKAIDEKLPQKFRKVEKNTQISKVMAQALLKQFNNDPKKASQEALKLGYKF